MLTYHSYSQLILYPWGYTTDPIKDAADLSGMRDLAEEMERLIRKVHGKSYTAKQSSKLYLTAGDTTDWTYGEYDAVSLTVELRPATWEEGGFILPADQIEPCREKNRPSALEFLQRVLQRPQDGGRGEG